LTLPERGDDILPFLAAGHLGPWVLIFFTLGITAASFSNADSALTSLTTSVCTDLLGMKLEDDAVGERRRWWIHLAMCVAFVLMVLLISQIQQSSLLKTIFTAKSDGATLEAYFAKVLPSYDRDRVYASDIKKVIQWYNLLLKKGFLEETSTEKEA